ncbi:MAG: tRNA lysidine(34) synthetase TilS [Patescibacteria group bacterium]|nr:tRNA lysidine(34) synthetase TilS [Patescibacteria group bacterium]
MIVKRAQNFVFHEKLFERGDEILIGVSGGPDSVALLRVLDALKGKMDLKLSLLHVNHALRGEESDKDEQFVRELAKQLEITLKVVKCKDKKDGESEEALREFRYEQFEKERKDKRLDWIAVGHTKDDQAETVLMNLLRGSGMKGLNGIEAKRGKVIRPLLELEKNELVSFLEKEDQQFRIDKSNFDEKYVRNKIRHKLIPLIEEEFNPKIKERLASLSKQVGQINLLVEQIAQKSYNDIGNVEKDKVTFKSKDLLEKPNAVRALIFRNSIKHLKGNVKNISAAHLFEFEKILSSGKSKNQIFLLGPVQIEKSGLKVVFQRK